MGTPSLMRKNMRKIWILVLLISGSVFADSKLLVLGDSLTEGYGVDQEYSYPSLLEEKIKQYKKSYKVINGGIAGSTTSSGLSRLNWYLKAKPKIVIIALGANDGLRGIKLDLSKKNLEGMIVKAKSAGAVVVLAGMRIPPNYGKEYTQKFSAMYTTLAKKHKTKLIPFLLKDVAGVKELNIEDGIHPNRDGYKIVAQTVFDNIKDSL